MYLLLFQIEVLSFHGFFHLDRSQVDMEADILRISEISFDKAFNIPSTYYNVYKIYKTSIVIDNKDILPAHILEALALLPRNYFPIPVLWLALVQVGRW